MFIFPVQAYVLTIPKRIKKQIFSLNLKFLFGYEILISSTPSISNSLELKEHEMAKTKV